MRCAGNARGGAAGWIAVIAATGLLAACSGGPGGPGGPGRPANGNGRQPGCLRQAQQQLYGSGGGDPVTGLAFQAATWAQSDPLVKAVTGAWAACMASRGYPYSQPITPALHRWPTPPARTEIGTAVADVTCKSKVNLVHTWLTVEAAYQQVLVNQNLAELAQLQSSYTGVLQRAQELLAVPAVPAVPAAP